MCGGVLRFAFFLLPALLAAGTTPPPAPSSLSNGNVNSRYTVEAIEFDSRIDRHLSRTLREELDRLVGDKFDPTKVTDLAVRIGREVRRRVSSRIEKGVQPEHVRLVFRSAEGSRYIVDADFDRLHYHSSLGLTFGAKTGTKIGNNYLGVGFQTDADGQLERQIGWSFDYRRDLGERVRFRFAFEALRQKWNAATLAAIEADPSAPRTYRERYRTDPVLEIALLDSLTLTTGISIQHLETQPQFMAARFDAANAWINTLRFRKHWQDETTSDRQEVEAGYHLRAATTHLGSDYSYTRHSAYALYRNRWGRDQIVVRAGTGFLSGAAPLYDRFTLGDSRTLRGWNRFDVAALGGNREAHGTVQYRSRCVGVFYDVGSVWDQGEGAEVRHSTGVFVAFDRRKDLPYFAVAFPIRNNAVVPTFLIGTDF